ncbi:GNAT family N-acetyltransferase [Zestomonas carbonaria]|uniref:Peptidyl-lysine N-acetyltransferase PatZ n=1 Tax=Zestomonas carbonaria TaxID=2762745 RepID=A0A7U7ESU6_9GAMM|nr:GNAT family N-acetyltransferase [Pseudomonas carbonaria]CAD5110445.1 Peptidyl-lysine N-acetyltransferase PatZ [Pseudomonas carbonaria]
MNTPQPSEIPEDHWVEKLKDGSHVLIRPLRPDDREREIEFIERLSPESRHFRFLHAIKVVSPALLDHLMHLDYRQTMAFVALAHEGGKLIEVGVSRYGATGDGQRCECAVAVADDWRRRGLATVLMRRLIDFARSKGFRQIYSVDSPSNLAVQSLARLLGTECQRDPEDPGLLIHSLRL